VEGKIKQLKEPCKTGTKEDIRKNITPIVNELMYWNTVGKNRHRELFEYKDIVFLVPKEKNRRKVEFLLIL
jgi:hypothetical protein